ncbi:hypothetical protein MVES1_000832 [Malassezia vespertilionis]|uniref:VTT domain-containing protein n=1 Tax=Malassezia vespertilionis TaxID=2020962 RepID=A0A2N1JFH9_9BASI|nr:uncharacterized protein MVES1_000832 [Malassezia vespertilionis]PKI85286.1 hypothetical protein MVES_000780 [Malassezia vespertilionis]WFD05502.1 hypothetical protein MVES1_000832 [Malassezia vespertilionis]
MDALSHGSAHSVEAQDGDGNITMTWSSDPERNVFFRNTAPEHAEASSVPQDDAWDDDIQLDTPFVTSSMAWQSVPSRNVHTAPISLSTAQRRKILLRTAVQFAVLFVGGTIVLSLALWLALPELDNGDREALRIPRSFEQLHTLNKVLKRYNEEHYTRVMLVFVCLYLFLQTFSVPGSMYMSILGGAMWGIPVALPLVCICIASGSTMCYALSRCAGQCIEAMPSWQQRVDYWKMVIKQYESNIIVYLAVLRMMPVPPDFMINLIAPHLGIGVYAFWTSTFLGVISTSLMHTAIGEELNEMTAVDGFHFFTWKNVTIFVFVIVAMVVPILVKRRFQAPEVLEETHAGPIHLAEESSPRIIELRRRGRALFYSFLGLVHPSSRRRAAMADAQPLSMQRDIEYELEDDAGPAWQYDNEEEGAADAARHDTFGP